MKKLLALSGVGSSMAFWAMTTMAPKVVAILTVLVINAINPGGGTVPFTTGTATLVGVILQGFVIDFFDEGIVNTLDYSNFFIGL